MSWENPVLPVETKNSIGFFVQFFLSEPQLVGDSVKANPVQLHSKGAELAGLVNRKRSKGFQKKNIGIPFHHAFDYKTIKI